MQFCFFFQFILFFIHILEIYSSEQTKCKTLKVLNQINNLQSKENSFIFQSDEEVFDSISDIGYDILNQNFQIDLEDDFQVIEIIKPENYKISTANYKNEVQEEICILAKSQNLNQTATTYFIGCTFIDWQTSNGKHNLGFVNIEKKIQIITQENCTKLVQRNKEKFQLFCHDEQYFKLYQIEAFEVLTTLLQFSRSNHELINCQIQLLEIDKFLLVSYLKCSSWAIYSINQNNDVVIYFDKEKKKEYNDQMFKLINLMNVQSCQNSLILVFQNGYITTSIDKQLNYNFKTFFMTLAKDEVLKQILFRNCQYDSFVITLKDQLSITQNQSRIQLGRIDSISIYQFKDIPIVVKQNFLEIIITSKIHQIYNFNFTKVDVFSNSNQICLIDNLNKQIKFFSFQQKQLILQKLGYFYEINTWDIFFHGKILNCYNMQVINEQDQNTQRRLPISNVTNDCLSNQQFFFWKNHENFKYPFLIPEQEYIFSNSTIYVRFFEKFELKSIRTSKYLEDKNAQLLYINIQRMDEQDHIIYLNETLHLIDFQGYNKEPKVKIEGQKVLNRMDIMVVYASQINELYLFSWHRKFNFTPFSEVVGVIDKIQIFQDQLIVKIANSEIHYVTNLDISVYPNKISQQLDQKLYLNQSIKFYYQNQDLIVIQYENIVQLKFKANIKLYDLSNYYLFTVCKHGLGYFLIGVNHIKQALKVFFIEDSNLIEIQNITLQNYTFSNTLEYQQFNEKLVILVNQKQELYLLFFIFEQNFLQLKQIIQTTNQKFYISSFYLTYQSQNNIFEVLNLDQLYVSFYLKTVSQTQYAENIQFQIRQIFQQNLEEEVLIGVHLILFNYCLIVQQKNELALNFQIASNKNSYKFNPQNYFFGQIDSYVIDTNNLKLLGPFIFEQAIKSCQMVKMEQCFRIIKFNYKNNLINLYETQFDDSSIEFVKVYSQNCPIKLFNSTFFLVVECKSQLTAVIIVKNLNDQNYTILQELHLQKPFEQFFTQCKISIEIENQRFLIYSNNKLMTILYMNGTKFISIQVNENVSNAIAIQNTEHVFLFCTKEDQNLEFTAQHIFDKSILIKKQINSNLLNIEFEYFFFNVAEVKYKVISASMMNLTLEFTLIQFTNVITRYILFKIDTVNLETSFIVRKYLRMPHLQQFSQFYLIDNHFFAETTRQNYYYYNLSQNQDFYDSLYFLEGYIFDIQKFNSTHFLFKMNGIIQVTRIQFEFYLNTDKQEKIQGKLFASNSHSNASVDIFFDSTIYDSLQIQENKFYQLCLIIFLTFMLIIYILLKFQRVNLKRKYHSSSKQINQGLKQIQ